MDSWPFIWAYELVRGRMSLKKLRERSAALGLPLERRMGVLATTQRLVVWRASRWSWRPPVLLGEVPRERIAGARFPFVGGGWRVVELHMVDGAGFGFRVDGASAEEFVAAFQ